MNQVTHDDIMESVKRLFEFTSVQYAGGISPGSDAAHEAIGMLLAVLAACLPAFICGVMAARIADERTERETTDSTPPETA